MKLQVNNGEREDQELLYWSRESCCAHVRVCVCEGSRDSPEHYQSQRSHSENGHTQPAWGNDLWGMSTLKEQESGGEMDEDRVTEQG